MLMNLLRSSGAARPEQNAFFANEPHADLQYPNITAMIGLCISQLCRAEVIVARQMNIRNFRRL